MLKTPDMRRRAKAVDTLIHRIQNVHTPAQRAGSPRDLADDLLSLHASDPQFVPESNLRFALSAALIASVYLGDAFSFAVYAMAAQPELYAEIQSEADALFDKGDPGGNDFTPSAIDVTHRFLMEWLRMYPIVPMSIRNVMNSCVVEDYELPVGSRIFIAQTASHYMEDIFPDPFKFDIDRVLAMRSMPLRIGYAHVPWLPVDGTATGRQCANGGALLYTQGVSLELQAKVQPVAVIETEQESEIPDRRAEARGPRLMRH